MRYPTNTGGLRPLRPAAPETLGEANHFQMKEWKSPGVNLDIAIQDPIFTGTLPRTKSKFTPGNRPFQKETSIPTIHFRVRTDSFREGYLSFPDIYPCLSPKTATKQRRSHASLSLVASPRGISQLLNVFVTLWYIAFLGSWRIGVPFSSFGDFQYRNIQTFFLL